MRNIGKKIKRATSLFLATLLVATSAKLPQYAVFATEGDIQENDTEIITEQYVCTDEYMLSNDELFAGYVDSLFLGDSIATYGRSARDQLTDAGQELYDYLKEEIESVASGNTASTEFNVDLSEFDSTKVKLTWTAEDFGVSKLSSVSNETFWKAAWGQFGFSEVIDALLHDCPYDLYWYDKTEGAYSSYSRRSSNNSISLVGINIKFVVASGYRSSSTSSKFKMDTTKAVAATTSANNAKFIVAINEALDDKAKLDAYHDAICGLTSYNSSAVSSSYTGGYGDPWQLIYVFDGDESTKVVCEGYSKAFQYLCDMSTFNNSIFCYTISGTLNNGGHMWNIVSMEDGKSYLVDVTNSDTSSLGTDGGLFLVGASGSIVNGYSLTIRNTLFKYKYFQDMITLWGSDSDSILALSSMDYVFMGSVDIPTDNNASAPPCEHEETDYSASGTTITATCADCGEYLGDITLEAPSGDSLIYDGSVKQAILIQSEENYFGDLSEYITYSGDCRNAGTYTATLKYMEQVVSVEFTIAKAVANISAINRGYVYAVTSEDTVNLAELLPADCGTITYGTPVFTNIVKSASVTNGVLLYTVEGGSIGDIGSITVAVTTQNYEDIVITVNIELSDKKQVTLKTGSSVTLKNSPLTYGESLSELEFDTAVFVDDSGNEVAGTLTWKTATMMPKAGVTSAAWVFTPDSEEYVTVEGSVSITVNKAVPTITETPVVASRTYNPSVPLADSDLTGGKASVEGTWSWQNAGIVPVVGNSGYVAVFTPNDAANYKTVTKTIEVAVTKATPYIVTVPSATEITYGDVLSKSVLSGGAAQYSSSNSTVVAGSFAWKSATIKPSVADSNTVAYTVVFTPVDTTNYNTVETTAKVIVNRAAASVSSINRGYVYAVISKDVVNLAELLPADCGTITYGTPVYTNIVRVANVTNGVLSYTVEGESAGDTGSITVLVTTQNYEDIIITVNIKLSDKKQVTLKTGTSVTLKNSPLTYGESLSELEFNSTVFVDDSGNEVAGTLTWKTATIIPKAGTTSAAWVFTPDSEEYATVEGSVSITVNKAIPTITEVPVVASRVYNPSVALADSDLTGGRASVAGTWSWQKSGVVPVTGVRGYVAVFTPKDTANYSSVETTINVPVTKATPYFATEPVASAITYGDALGESALAGGVAQHSSSNSTAVAGSFAWKSATIMPSVADSNTTAYTVVFTPVDTANYNTVETTVKLTVNKAAVSASSISRGYVYSVSNKDTVNLAELLPADCGTIIYGTPAYTNIIKIANVTDGVLTYTIEGGSAGDTGSITVRVITQNYEDIIITVNIKLSDKKQVTLKTGTSVTLKDSTLTYGQALSELEFNSSVFVDDSGNEVSGTLAWKDANATPSVGITSAAWVFTPNSKEYTTVEGTVSISVKRAAPSITEVPVVASRTYNPSVALTNSDLTGGKASVAGTWSWQKSGVVPVTGVRGYVAVFTPNDTTNYSAVAVTIAVTVTKATPYISAVPSAKTITYGSALSASDLSDGVAQHSSSNSTAVEGSFWWKGATIKPSVADSNTTEYIVVFTPVDTNNYNTVETTVKVTVTKATPYISAVPSAKSITYGSALSASDLSDGVAQHSSSNSNAVAGSFVWKSAAIKPSVADSNMTAYTVVFIPDDAINYNTVETTVKVTVNKATPYISVVPSAKSITYGSDLSIAALSGGVAQHNSTVVAGSFEWKSATIKPSVADSNVTEYTVVFTPNDTTNYNTAEASVKVTVNKAATSVSAIKRGYIYAITSKDSVNLAELLPADCGAITYGTPAFTNIVKAASVTNGVLSYTVEGENAGDTGSITIKVTTQNYEDIVITVNIELSDKKQVALKMGSSVTLKNSTLTYGESLSELEFNSAVFVDDSGNEVEGTLAWKTVTMMPKAGTTSVAWVFTPDSEEYATVEGTVSITVNKAVPTISEVPVVASRTYNPSVALEDSDLTGGKVSVAGTWSWQNTDIVPVVGNSGYVAVFTPNDINYKTVTKTITVTVAKATPYIATVPSTTEIAYGDALSVSSLSDGVAQHSSSNSTAVAGSFAWKSATIKPSVADSNTTAYTVVFTPNDTINYNTVETTVKVTVNKAVASGVSSINRGYVYSVTNKDTVNLADILPADCGTVTYGIPAFTNIVKVANVTNGVLSYTVEGESAGDTGSITVLVTTQNYEDIVIIVNIELSDKEQVLLKPGYSVTLKNSILTYGQTLSGLEFNSAVFVDKDGNELEGTLAWRDAAAMPNAGTTSAAWVFTPDSEEYATVEGSVSITVNKAIPTITEVPVVASRVYNPSVALADSDLSGGKTNVEGTWSWLNTGVVPVVGNSGYAIVFTPTDTTNYNRVAMIIAVKVTKATPYIVTAPSATEITYGDALSEAALSGGVAQHSSSNSTAVAGSFEWKSATEKPLVSDSNVTAYKVIFTPFDTANYNIAETTVKVTVNKITTSVSAINRSYTYSITSKDTVNLAELLPTDCGTITYGTPVFTTIVKAAKVTNGVLSYTVEGGSAGATGSITVNVKTQNYEDITISVNIKLSDKKQVSLKTGSLVTLKNSTLTYGESLSELEFNAAVFVDNGGNGVAGTLAWKNATIIPNTGATSAAWVFTPNSKEYATVEGTASITVNKAVPTIIEVPVVANRTYNPSVALADSDLTGGRASVEGSWSWMNVGAIPATGVNGYVAVFTPTDIANYEVVTKTIEVKVTKATPYIVTAPSATSITYGDALSESALSGGVAQHSSSNSTAVAGSFAWKSATVKPSVADSDVTVYKVVFTPDDATNYNTVEATVKVTVNKATPYIATVPSATEITYGDALSASTLSDGVAQHSSSNSTAVAGSFAWKSATIKPSVADSNVTEYAVVFTPNDTANYNTVEATVKVTVNKITTSVSVINRSYTYSITSKDTVNLAELLPADCGAITYGDPVFTNIVKAASVTNGVLSYTVEGENAGDTGSITIKVTTQNYEDIVITVNIELSDKKQVAPKTGTSVTLKDNTLTYGESLSELEFNGAVFVDNSGNAVAGTLEWKNATVMPKVGTTSAVWVFTPNSKEYATVEGTASITVNKAVPTIIEAPVVANRTYNPAVALADSDLIGGKASVEGTWSWLNVGVIPMTGLNGYVAVFTPDDEDNYSTVAMTIAVTVTKATPYITTVPSATEITYGDALSASVLSDGVAQHSSSNSTAVAGSFAWENATIKPSVADSNVTEYAVVFTPNDTANYNTVEATVKVTVNKAVTSVSAINRDYTYSITSKDTVNLAELLPADCGAITYGAPAFTDIVKAASVTNGVLSYTVEGESAGDTGSITIKVTTQNYEDIVITVNIELSDKKQVTLKTGTSVTLKNSTLTYGESLSELEFNGAVFVDNSGNAVAGTLEWKDAAAMPNAGATSAVWVFTPDSEEYATVEGTVSITVNKAVPTIIEAPVVANRTYNPAVALADSDLTGGKASVAGTWSWQNMGIVPVVGNSGYVAVFTPNDTVNCETITKTVAVTVTKATPYITTVPSATEITYGDALSASTLSDGVAQHSSSNSTAVAGSFAWKNATIKPSVADSNTTAYTVVFTPVDEANYNVVETAVKVTVNKLMYAPNMPDTTMSVEYGCKTAGDVTLPDGWSWNDADIVLGAGKTVNATAIYMGVDAGNYENVEVVIAIARAACEHSNTEVRNSKASTCTQNGYTGDTFCIDCGEKIASGTDLPLVSHRYTSSITQAPTTESEGVRTYTCSACGDSYTTSIPKLESEVPDNKNDRNDRDDKNNKNDKKEKKEKKKNLKSGWNQVDDKWYYGGEDGVAETGWLQDENDNWYYLEEDGAMTTGWVCSEESGLWYYMDSDNGQMISSGWLEDPESSRWYYLDPNGAMCTGWIFVDNIWYLLDQNGSMCTGWNIVNNKWYYLDMSGRCLMNTITPDGYRVDENGVWIE